MNSEYTPPQLIVSESHRAPSLLESHLAATATPTAADGRARAASMTPSHDVPYETARRAAAQQAALWGVLEHLHADLRTLAPRDYGANQSRVLATLLLEMRDRLNACEAELVTLRTASAVQK